MGENTPPVTAVIPFYNEVKTVAGIAEQLIRVMIDEGLSDAEARKRVYMVDRFGLLHSDMDGLMAFQERLTQDHGSVASWSSAADGSISLLDVVKNGMPSILIGVSGQHGLFTEEIIREMAKNTERPIIFPLSNPTSRAEAVPEDILEWTDGQALIGTGSPFEPVTFKGKTHHIAQSNNTYIFPGVGLGVLAGGATRVTDNMFMASSRALAELSPALKDPHAALLPPISDIREVSKAVALAVAKQAVQDKVAPDLSGAEIVRRIEERFWTPAYQELM